MLRHIANTNLGRQLRSSAAVGGDGLRRMDHCKNPRTFDKNDPNVGACGDVMKSQIRVDEATRKIFESLFENFGSGSGPISLTPRWIEWGEWAKGRSIEEVLLSIENMEKAKHPSLPPAEDATKAAVRCPVP